MADPLHIYSLYSLGPKIKSKDLRRQLNTSQRPVNQDLLQWDLLLTSVSIVHMYRLFEILFFFNTGCVCSAEALQAEKMLSNVTL